jgi:hypothetical protein
LSETNQEGQGLTLVGRLGNEVQEAVEPENEENQAQDQTRNGCNFVRLFHNLSSTDRGGVGARSSLPKQSDTFASN